MVIPTIAVFKYRKSIDTNKSINASVAKEETITKKIDIAYDNISIKYDEDSKGYIFDSFDIFYECILTEFGLEREDVITKNLPLNNLLGYEKSDIKIILELDIPLKTARKLKIQSLIN